MRRLRILLGGIFVVSMNSCLVLAGDGAEELRTLLKDANEAYIKASHSLQVTELEPFFEGKALADLSTAIRNGRAAGFYIDFELLSTVVESINIGQTGDSAEAVVSETWQSTSYDLGSGACLGWMKPRTLRQTYHLRFRSCSWRIVDIEEDAGSPEGVIEPCPGKREMGEYLRGQGLSVHLIPDQVASLKGRRGGFVVISEKGTRQRLGITDAKTLLDLYYELPVSVHKGGIWVVLSHPEAYTEAELGALENLRKLCEEDGIPLYTARASDLPSGWRRSN